MQKLGEAGGQGVLYRAHRKGAVLENSVVVKTLKQSKADDSKAIQRFLLEGSR